MALGGMVTGQIDTHIIAAKNIVSVICCSVIFTFGQLKLCMMKQFIGCHMQAFYQEFFRGSKIYCYPNFFCYANFSIAFGPFFWGGAVMESQHDLSICRGITK